jgi:hypothetical protein
MKRFTSHPIRELGSVGRAFFLASFLTLFLGVTQLRAQQYATVVSSDVDRESALLGAVVAPATVANPANAGGTADANFATLTVGGLRATNAITVDSRAWINFQLPEPVAAGKYTYIRIDTPTTTGISLGLDDLVNLLGLLSNNYIQVSATGGTASRALVRDAAGNLYVAVTSSADYQNIRLTLDFSSAGDGLGDVLAIGTLSLNVYHVVTYENGTFATCSTAVPTFTGVSPSTDLLNVSLVGLLEPQKAIDGIVSPSNYSLLRKDVGVLTTAAQTFYLGKTAPATNEIVATISKPAGLADITALNDVRIEAFNGTSTEPVASQTLEELLLGIKLLDFQGSNPVSISFRPNVAHDRIVIRHGGVAGVLVELRIHELGSRPPVIFKGGRLLSSIAGDPIELNLTSAAAIPGSEVVFPGFSIACGSSTDYRYFLEDVTRTGRTLAGTLPSSLTLSELGVLTGTPTNSQVGTYTFDVRALNIFGQSAVASFRITIDPSLPVTLVSFDAREEGTTASLSWATSEETNSDRFDVERSQNGKVWSKIGSVKSNQESSTAKYYSFVDATPAGGKNFYRLKMVDLDETFTYSQIKEASFASNAFLSPNPIRGDETLKITLTDWSKVKQIQVINAAGKIVFAATNALSAGISTRNLTEGSYIVKVLQIDGNVLTHRFVRQ